MKIDEFNSEMQKRLCIPDYGFDISLNGLQVTCSKDKEIKKVMMATDACQYTIDRAIEEKADVLFVHHGLFWGRPLAIDGPHYNRIKALIENDIALYACHLPLDAHHPLGNNAQMALALDVEEAIPFGLYHGKCIGSSGTLKKAMNIKEICERLGFAEEYGLRVLPFGKTENIKTVAMISGAGGEDVDQAIAMGFDCYITGELPHQVYHDALEYKMTVIAGGHYQTEVFGVKAVGKLLAAEYGLETAFIEKRTGL